jgi:hypothetical protein
MINLLPDDNKKAVTREYRWRLIIVASCLMSASAIIGGTFLVPSYLLVLTKARAAADDLANAQKALESSGSSGIETATASLGSKLALLRNKNPEWGLSSLLSELAAARVNGVTITGIRTNPDKNSGFTLTIVGHARDRQQLLLFTEALKQNPRFSNIDLPIDELVKNADIPYQITLAYKHGS